MSLTLPRQAPTNVTPNERTLFQRLYDLRDYVLQHLLKLQVNGKNSGSQTLLNLVQGTNVTITDNGSGDVTIAATGGGGGGSGTVTSVGLTMPAEFTVAGSPVTTTGTLGVTKATQAANKVWAGPTSGGAAAPTFRSLVSADLPSASGNFADSETPSGTINGSNATFTLANTPITGSLHLYLNGRRQAPTADYTIATATITMINVPATGDTLLADYRY
jgi:hypothetical protein